MMMTEIGRRTTTITDMLEDRPTMSAPINEDDDDDQDGNGAPSSIVDALTYCLEIGRCETRCFFLYFLG